MDKGREGKLWATLGLVGLITVAEVVGGFWSGSLALVADAGHMVSDAASLGITLAAIRMAKRLPDRQTTYGYQRAEILAATVNAALLLGISGWILVEAWERWQDPGVVLGAVATGVAVVGLLANLLSMKVLGHHHGSDLNLRSAWLHVVSDTLGSVGAILAGAVIWGGGPLWVDPLISVVIALLVLRSGWSLLGECVDVLMERAPVGVDVARVREEILRVGGVCGVHDLHVWSLSAGRVAMSGHVVVEGSKDVIPLISNSLKVAFGIDHVTIQVEAQPCGGGCEGNSGVP